MRIKKLILSAVTAAAMAAVCCLNAAAQTSSATDAENRERENFHRSGTWGYTLLDDNTAALSRYYGNSVHPSVPDKIDGYTVTAISGGWYTGSDGKPVLYGNVHGLSYTEDGMIEDCQIYSPFSENADIEVIMLPDTIEYIGAISFRNCTSLKTIRLPENLKFLGNNCFDGCSSLESIVIPSKVEYIDQAAFKNCRSLSSVTMQSAHCEHAVFENCASLKDFTLPLGTAEIPPYMFSGCKGLTQVTIPEGTAKIGEGAFADCTALASISLPDTLTEIHNDAFKGCSSLMSAELGKLETLGSGAFAGCGFTELTVPETLMGIGENAFGTDTDGNPKSGFVLKCPKYSAAADYANKHNITVEGGEQQESDVTDGDYVVIKSPISSDLLFKVVVAVIALAAAAVLVVIILMIKNQRTAAVPEIEGLDTEETEAEASEEETEEESSQQVNEEETEESEEA